MPEPYPFPQLPEEGILEFKDEELQPIAMGLAGGVPLIMTPPTEASNFVSFFFKGDVEVWRWALIEDDDGNWVPINEDGIVTTLDALTEMAFKVAMGTEAYVSYGMEAILRRSAEEER